MAWWRSKDRWWTKKQGKSAWPRECRACMSQIERTDPRCMCCGLELSGKDPLVGRSLDRYQLIERAGQGTCGAVYLVKDQEEGGHYALRLIRPRLLAELGGVESLREHIACWGQLSHPRIARLVEHNEAGELGFYWVVEWLEGSALNQLMREQRAGLPYRQVISLMGQICEALQTIHERGFLHGQLRPGHVLLLGQSPRYRVKVFDIHWGQLFWENAHLEDWEDPRHLRTGWYLAPEQFMGESERIDRRADIYACGVLLVQLLTGSVPFRGSHWKDLQNQHLYTPPPRLSVLHPSKRFCSELEALIRRALAKQPQDRFQSIQSFWQHLQSIPEEEAVLDRLVVLAEVRLAEVQVPLSPQLEVSLAGGAVEKSVSGSGSRRSGSGSRRSGSQSPEGLQLERSGYQASIRDEEELEEKQVSRLTAEGFYLGQGQGSMWERAFWLLVLLGLLFLGWDWWRNI